jgi:hypothetical protein
MTPVHTLPPQDTFQYNPLSNTQSGLSLPARFLAKLFYAFNKNTGCTRYYYVRFQVITTASTKMTAFWDIEPCSLVEVDRRFRGAYCLPSWKSITLA